MHLKRRNSWPPGVSALDALNDFTWHRHLAEIIIVFSALFFFNNFLLIVLFSLCLTLKSSLRAGSCRSHEEAQDVVS